MLKIELIPRAAFDELWKLDVDRSAKLALTAEMCRFNTLSAVKLAGSGHLGSSFSAMDIAVWLYFHVMNTREVGIASPDRDIYFSSKGHDVPGLYAIFYALGIIPEEQLLQLRRLGGLDGHPDVGVSGIESNTGSLGMGISKGRGFAWAKRYQGHRGRIFVMTGDGELQEGQIYEALQTTAHQRIDNMMVFVDHNKYQTDKPVEEITALGDLMAKFQSFGWDVARCDGHDFRALDALLELPAPRGKAKIVIADTVKGKGVSFMEPAAIRESGEIYRWHSGAPDDASFMAAADELRQRIVPRVREIGLQAFAWKDVTPPPKKGSGVTPEYVAEHYGQALVEIAKRRKDIVVLDGDLSADCRVRAFEKTFPERFIENGIAEQDMVSMAGGLARHGLLPVVNSFASFLAARANEQIYNNACEKTKIIYACHFAGMIPAGPGKSHQSVRDISLFGALPNCTIIQPCNGVEAKLALEYCVDEAQETCALRLAIGPSPRSIVFPADYQFTLGRGVTLRHGSDAILFAYGPVMLHEALTAAEMLERQTFQLSVVNMPWLNRIDIDWLAKTVTPFRRIYVLEDHSSVGGLGDRLLASLVSHRLLGTKEFHKVALEGYPACGTPAEVLRHHGLDGGSLVQRIMGGGSEACLEAEPRSDLYSAEAPQ